MSKEMARSCDLWGHAVVLGLISHPSVQELSVLKRPRPCEDRYGN